MRTCWSYDPRKRPAFHQIVRHLQEFTLDDFRPVIFDILISSFYPLNSNLT